MRKNLEELKLKYKKYCGLEDKIFEKLKFHLKILVAVQPNISGRGSALFKHIIYTLVDFEKRLRTIEAELGIYTEEEIEKIKVGGTDPD